MPGPSQGTLEHWWGGSRDGESAFVFGIRADDGSGGIYRMVLRNSAVISSSWMLHMRSVDRLRAQFEAAVLREMIAGAGQSAGGLTTAVGLLELEGFIVPVQQPTDFELQELGLSTPAPLPSADFIAAARTPGFVALQMPRDAWRGLMSIPTDEPVGFVDAIKAGGVEPIQLSKAVWAIQQRASFTPPALFEVATGGDSPLQLVDLLGYDGVDLREQPWSERRALMSEAISELAGAGARMSDIRPLIAMSAVDAVAIELWQLWLVPTDAPYGSGLRSYAR